MESKKSSFHLEHLSSKTSLATSRSSSRERGSTLPPCGARTELSRPPASTPASAALCHRCRTPSRSLVYPSTEFILSVAEGLRACFAFLRASDLFRSLINDCDFLDGELSRDFRSLLGHHHHLFKPHTPLKRFAMLR